MYLTMSEVNIVVIKYNGSSDIFIIFRISWHKFKFNKIFAFSWRIPRYSEQEKSLYKIKIKHFLKDIKWMWKDERFAFHFMIRKTLFQEYFSKNEFT